MTTGPAPICLSCKHLNSLLVDGRMKCTAFPAGIPDDILRSRHDHRKPHVGDLGIRFSQVVGDDEPPWDSIFPTP